MAPGVGIRRTRQRDQRIRRLKGRDRFMDRVSHTRSSRTASRSQRPDFASCPRVRRAPRREGSWERADVVRSRDAGAGCEARALMAGRTLTLGAFGRREPDLRRLGSVRAVSARADRPLHRGQGTWRRRRGRPRRSFRRGRRRSWRAPVTSALAPCIGMFCPPCRAARPLRPATDLRSCSGPRAIGDRFDRG